MTRPGWPFVAPLLASLLAAGLGGASAVEYAIQYTDPATNLPLPLRTADRAESPQDTSSAASVDSGSGLGSMGFGPLPCDCQGEGIGCGCCAGLSMPFGNWSRRACFNMTYDPWEFAVGVNLLMDGESVFQRSVSGKNPPPLCVPLPTPLAALAVTVDFCVRLFNVSTPPPGLNLHTCINFETRISRAPVFVLEFDCPRVGSAGVFLLKPEDGGAVTNSSSSSSSSASGSTPGAGGVVEVESVD